MKPKSHFNRLTLRRSEFEDYVEVLIDGVVLGEFLSNVLQLQGGHPSQNSGIGWHWVTDGFETTAFSRATMTPGFAGTALLFTCGGCNVMGCSDTTVQVRTDETSITWESGETFPWPLVFWRTRYMNEVARMSSSPSPQPFPEE